MNQNESIKRISKEQATQEYKILSETERQKAKRKVLLATVFIESRKALFELLGKLTE